VTTSMKIRSYHRCDIRIYFIK